MSQLPVFTAAGEQAGAFELADDVFALTPNRAWSIRPCTPRGQIRR